MRVKEDSIVPSIYMLDDRACAHQSCAVFLRQAYPNAAVMTYDRTQMRADRSVMLAKFVVGVGEDEPEWICYEQCDESTTADNIPGGLKSRCSLTDGSSFTAQWHPLLFGENMAWEGAALLHIHSDVKRRFWLKFGSGDIAYMHVVPNRHMSGPEIDCREGWAKKEEDCILIGRRDRPLTTAVKGNFDSVSIEALGESDGFGTYAVACAETTDLYAVVGFAEKRERAIELASCDPVYQEARTADYYKELLDSWQLQTPDKDMNEAFSHALLNVEYSWLRPLGWIESIHHWTVMYHMEQIAAEEWNGRFDRVKECLKTQMNNAFENGGIPEMCPAGTGRHEWGGENHFFIREAEHYIRMTGDMDFAREAEPYMERALRQSFEEYDPTDSGIIGWGTQIGNQEDFESTPGKGAATGSEGARMLEIMAYIKELLGKKEEADYYAALSQRSRKQWYDTLWLRDLGRPAWYEDTAGEIRKETTYHGIIYPILYDQIDDMDKTSALDHLQNRMTGPEGEIYQSNHFGNHDYWGVPTWGMQCGSDMQPFAAAAYAAVGKPDEAIKPLQFVARRVCGEYQRGAWPETANEKRFAYFSPSAAVFSQAVIESIFGLKRDMPQNKTVIAPCIPHGWPDAALKIPGICLQYTAAENGFTLRVQINDDTSKIIKVICPPAVLVTALIGDKKLDTAPVQHCSWSTAEFDAGTGRDISFTCCWKPLRIECDCPPWAVCGEDFTVTFNGGAEIIGIEDRCGVMQSVRFNGGRFTGRIRADLFKDYEAFGKFGIINFARRTLFFRLRTGGTEIIHPCSITVVPALECRAEAIGSMVRLQVCNQSGRELTGPWRMFIGRRQLLGEGTVAAHSQGSIDFPCGGVIFSPGKNKAFLQTPAYMPLTVEAAAQDARVLPLPLDKSMCRPFEYWREIGIHPHHGFLLQSPDCFMQGLEQCSEIPIMDGIPLALNPAGFIPFSREKHPVVTIPLQGKRIKKLYVLCSAFIDNHDALAKILRIEAEAVKHDEYLRPVYNFDIYFPGAIEVGFGGAAIVNFSTFSTDSAELEPPFKPGQTDYNNVMPPVYPQKHLWCSSRAFECCNTVFNLLELDLGAFREMKEMRIIACEADAAGGIFALAAHIEQQC